MKTDEPQKVYKRHLCTYCSVQWEGELPEKCASCGAIFTKSFGPDDLARDMLSAIEKNIPDLTVAQLLEHMLKLGKSVWDLDGRIACMEWMLDVPHSSRVYAVLGGGPVVVQPVDMQELKNYVAEMALKEPIEVQANN